MSSDNRAKLAQLSSWLPSIDVSSCPEHELRQILLEVRNAQRCLDGLAVRIGTRSQELADAGHGEPTIDFLRGGGRVGSGQARREAARTTASSEIEGLAAALSRGETSAEHADTLARQWSRLTTDERNRFATDEMLREARRLPIEPFARLVKRHADAAIGDHGLSDNLAKRARSHFRHWFDRGSGMGRFSGSLDPERYEQLTNAIDQRVASLAAEGDQTSEPVAKNPALAATALVDLTAAGDRPGRRRPAVTVLVDAKTLRLGPHQHSVCETESGSPIPPESVARLCCDALLRRVMLDPSGLPIDVGRRHRTATDAQWAALKSMYHACAWEGCAAPISWCQAHHIREWEHGGRTDLGNLVPLCSRHHHLVHEGHWQVRLLDGRSLELIRPDGRVHAVVPFPRRGPPRQRTSESRSLHV